MIAQSEGRANKYDTIIVACGVMAIGIAKVYWLMRIGFDDPIMTVARPVALALFIFAFPATVNGIVWRKNYTQPRAPVRWWLSYPFLWLVAVALSATLGRLVQTTGINAFPALAVIGLISFGVVFVRWLPGSTVLRTLGLLLGSGLFSVWASGVVWGRIYKNPLFYENFVLNGNVHHDSLHLAAFANMLRTYHVPSTGIDGLARVPYHWGTQWLFAQWSNLTGSSILDFYQLGFPVMMIPFFFGGVLGLAAFLRGRRRSPAANEDLRADNRFWFVFLAACIGILPIKALEAMGVWTSNLLISESYTVAVPCALLLLATAIAFHDNLIARGERQASTAETISDAIFVVALLPIGIAMLGYLKSSLMMLGFVLALYAFVRLGFYRRPLYWLSAVVATLLFVVTWHQVILPAHEEGFQPLDFLWNFVKPAWWPFFLIVQLFWSWLYVFVRLRSEGVGTLGDLKEAASERRLLDVEAVVLVALFGLGPGLVTHIDGGAAFYFSDVQRWLAVGFILSRIPEFFTALLGETPAPVRKSQVKRTVLSRLDDISVRSVVIVFLLIPVVASMIANSLVWPIEMARENAETRHGLYPTAVAAQIPLGLHGLPHLTDHAFLDEGLRQAPNFVVGDALKRLGALPYSERRRTAVFVPQDQLAYWKSLTRPGACTFQSFLVPALAAMAMVDGMPPYGCTLNRYYGIGSFAPRTRPQLAEDETPGMLCRRAEQSDLNRVMVLKFDQPRTSTISTIDCRHGSD